MLICYELQESFDQSIKVKVTILHTTGMLFFSVKNQANKDKFTMSIHETGDLYCKPCLL